MDDLITTLRHHCQGAAHGPKYLQLAQAIETVIRQRVLAPHDFLPAERVMAEGLGLSRVTVTKAIAQLEKQGLVIRQQGIGTRVAQHLDYSLNAEPGFTAQVEREGGQVSNQWLLRVKLKAPALIASSLGIASGAPIAKLRRIRLVDGVPVSLETTYIPEQYLPDPAQLEHSLYALWESRGIRAARKTFSLKALACTAEVAEWLNIQAGAPLMRIKQLSYGPDDSLLEYSETLCRSDIYEIEFNA
ncbi:GntR family transcriptional regulator [Pseudomonas sp. GL-RE-26]|uniref:GntR family transcriptional regulator n=1 Tax=Pseudomonas sp. GL-RE-26 TaxID=2832390 RepID=UPI001CBC8473|nr:GntR family transcriptional regulator [Pseudomonas sp. GL-RE-26]